MTTPDPVGEYETATRDIIYRVLVARKKAFLQWRDLHRSRYQAMEQEIAGKLGLDDVGRELLAHIVRKWL